MTAGRRDNLITIQRGTPTTDNYGEETLTWANLATAWAAVFYGKGDERRQAAMEQGRQPATFQVLSNSVTRAVSLEDRIVHNGMNWDIEGIAPMDRAHIEFTAVAAGAAAPEPEPEPGTDGQLDFSVASNSALLALLEDA